MAKQYVILDATLLSSLQACARKFDFNFNQLWQPKGGKTNSLECGSLAHIILEFFNKAIIAGKSRTDAIIIGFAAGQEYIDGFKPTNLFFKLESDEFIHNTPPESGKIGKKNVIGWKYVLNTMQQYFDHYKNDVILPLAAEEVRGKIIYDDDELQVMWKAKYDLIYETNGGIFSKDYKTMQQRKDPIGLNNQFTGQCLVLGTRSVIIDKIGFQTSLKPDEKFIRDTISYSADRLVEFAHDIVPFYARMLLAFTESGIFPADYTGCEGMYGWCKYKEICEADRSMRDGLFNLRFVKGKVWDISNVGKSQDV